METIMTKYEDKNRLAVRGEREQRNKRKRSSRAYFQESALSIMHCPHMTVEVIIAEKDLLTINHKQKRRLGERRDIQFL